MRIRDDACTDMPYLYEICLKTGDSGGDATALYSDPFLIGQYYAAPYAAYDPRSVLILEGGADGGNRPVGYILGAVDTAAYHLWFDREWRPALTSLYREGPVKSEIEKSLRSLFTAPFELPAFHAEYPGHIHIDLLPEAQGAGWGRKLMDAFSERLQVLGCPGFHLGVDRNNVGGMAFYRRYGMVELEALEWGWYFGKKLQPPPGSA